METVREFILGGSKVTADGDCSHEIKRHLFLERKAMTNLDSVLKRRDIKVCIVKAMIFPVVMYRCESWTIKKPECLRSDAFKLWWWRRIGSPLGRKEIKPVSPKENQPWIFIGRDYAEVQAPVFWPPDAKSQLFAEDLDLGKD